VGSLGVRKGAKISLALSAQACMISVQPVIIAFSSACERTYILMALRTAS